MGQAEKIVTGLGGRGNIVEIEGCVTRLRSRLADASLVDESLLLDAGAHDVLRTGSTVVQVVVGPEADPLAEEIEFLIRGTTGA